MTENITYFITSLTSCELNALNNMKFTYTFTGEKLVFSDGRYYPIISGKSYTPTFFARKVGNKYVACGAEVYWICEEDWVRTSLIDLF